MENSVNFQLVFSFISHKNSKETCTMYTKSRNIEIMVSNETDEITAELFESFLQNYLDLPKRGSEFVPDRIDLLYYHLQKVGLTWIGSYIDSPEWLKNKKKQ